MAFEARRSARHGESHAMNCREHGRFHRGGARMLVENELRKGGATDMMEKIQDAVRTLLAAALVQCCEVVDEKLAHWLGGNVGARRRRAWRHHADVSTDVDLVSSRAADQGPGQGCYGCRNARETVLL